MTLEIWFVVVIDSGSRYEVAYPSGISHFLEKLAFGVIILKIIILIKGLVFKAISSVYTRIQQSG